MDRHILIIDGNEKMRQLLAANLGGAGYGSLGVANGLDAAMSMRVQRPDLVLIDQGVDMGGVRTARLLRLHRDYQRIPIVLMFERDDATDELIKEGCKINLHRFLKKPFGADILRQTVKDAMVEDLPELNVDIVREHLGDMSNLPVLRPNQRRLLSLLGSEDASVDLPEVVRCVETDQGLTTTVMRICHSAYYGFRGNSIEGAVTFLGIDRMRRIVQAVIVFDAFASERDRDREEEFGFSIDRLWKHSLACGVVMEESGRMVRGRDHFIAGLLHDIGKVVLYLRFPEHFSAILRLVRDEGKSMYQAERALLGICHTDIGYELARRWDLPPTIAACLAHHHNPQAALQHKRLVCLVHLSDLLVRVLGIGNGGDDKKPTMSPAAQSLAKYVLALAERKEDIEKQVESMMGDGVSN
jgi:putative nucleotidyltransferase with HDIG domain